MAEPTTPSPRDITLALTRAWCEGSERQAQRFREASACFTSKAKSWRHSGEADRTDAAEKEVTNAAEAQWVEAHLLVIAARQMVQWATKAAEDSGQPGSGNVLRDLRNTLEHLDQAEINAELGEAKANRAIKKHQSINNLPGSTLPLSVRGGLGGLYLFDVLFVTEIEHQCRQIREMIVDTGESGQV